MVAAAGDAEALGRFLASLEAAGCPQAELEVGGIQGIQNLGDIVGQSESGTDEKGFSEELFCMIDRLFFVYYALIAQLFCSFFFRVATCR